MLLLLSHQAVLEQQRRRVAESRPLDESSQTLWSGKRCKSVKMEMAWVKVNRTDVE